MTNAELAILSLTAEKPRHGYEIEQVIETRGMREWTEIGFSSIYYLLKKLEKAGLVESETVPSQGRGGARRVYQITNDGRAALRDATLNALSQPKNSYPTVLLGIANLPILPATETVTALHSYRDGLEERMAHINAQLEAQRPLPNHVELLFDYSLMIITAEKTWIDTLIQTMEA